MQRRAPADHFALPWFRIFAACEDFATLGISLVLGFCFLVILHLYSTASLWLRSCLAVLPCFFRFPLELSYFTSPIRSDLPFDRTVRLNFALVLGRYRSPVPLAQNCKGHLISVHLAVLQLGLILVE